MWAWHGVGGGALGLLLVGGVLSASCGEPGARSERLSKATGALAPVVSDEVHLDTTTAEYEGSTWQAEVVCGEARCATFFETGKSDDHLYMVPGPGTERPIDLGPFPFVNVLGSLLLLPLPDDEFLILGTQQTGTYTLEPFARRIRGSDGKDMGSVPEAFELSTKLDVHDNGDSILAIDRDEDGYRAQVFDAATFEPRGAAAPIAYTVPDNWGPPPVVVAGDESFLIVWKGNAQRVDAATGAVLDATPLEPSKFSSGPTAGAYRDGVFYLSWLEFRGVVMSRIRESDGASLDPDDDFNEVSGAQVVCTGTCTAGARFEPVSVSALGDDIVVTWSTQPSSSQFLTQAVLVDSTTGSRAAGEATDPATTLMETGPYRGEPRRFVFHSSSAVVLEDNYATYLSLELDPLGATVEDDILLGRGRLVPGPPSVARANGIYLVTWKDGWAQIQAARVNEAGQLIEAPFPVDTFVDSFAGVPSFAVVSSNGTDFLVAWTDGSLINRRIVRANGDMEAPIGLLPDAGSIPLNVQLVWNGDYFFLTYKIGSSVYGLRLEPDGTAVEDPVYLGQGSNHVTLADWTPPSNARTFVVVLSDGTVRRLRSQSGALVSATSGVCASRGAGDGERLFAVCGDLGFLLDPITGTRLSGSDVVLNTVAGVSTAHVNHVWHDGRSFNVLFDRPYEGFDSHFTLRRFDETLTELDADVGGYGHFVSTVDYYEHAAAAAGANGSSLVAYQTFDHRLFGAVLKARIIKNDGLVAPPSDGDRDPGDEPGAAGAAGESGVGGSSATGGSGGLGGSSDTGGDTGTGGIPSAGGVSGAAGVIGGSGETGGGEGGTGALDGGASASGRGGIGGKGGTATASGGGTARAGESNDGGEGASGGTSGTSAGGAPHAGRGNAGSPAGPGGASGNGSGDSGGCGCSVPARSSGQRGALMLGILSLGLLLRRRRIGLR